MSGGNIEKDREEVKEYGEKVRRFFDSRRRMPSFSELMTLWGYRTKSAVHYRVEQLLQAGFISKDRTGKLLPGWEDGVKLLGLVEAGFPSPAEEELLDVMNFDQYLTPNKESSYILKVKGDSMIEAGIQPGDMVIVERKAQYKPGQIVIANVDGEYTMKYLRLVRGATAEGKQSDKYFLEPANKKYKPIYPTESFRIEAVVTAVVRKY
jgi:SOS regulatory protein LexA